MGTRRKKTITHRNKIGSLLEANKDRTGTGGGSAVNYTQQRLVAGAEKPPSVDSSQASFNFMGQ